ncbi:ABC transporter ATP-binding protein [Nocardioides sp. LHD-245]|uniref:ABC transporter ATP-binding protein n=1 Tax=Nocardioides sp. LHD-245 TaxID=3051387 RepID=UPI0027DF2D72|nr:ABC transporter ATP-binding protein [Nocardioides sp. LHD-245]
MTSPLLEIGDVVVDLPGRGTVLRDITLAMASGESLGLVGESGAGKSMLARAVAGLLPAGAARLGTIRFDGAPLSRSRTGRDGARRRLGMVFQDARAHLDPRQRIGDFLLETTPRRARPARLPEVLALLDRVGLAEPRRLLDRYPDQLSGGMLQRIMIASVVLADPALVLADEPTTALDVTTQAEVVAILDELRRERGTGLLFISHDLDLAAQLCDRIAVLYAGTVQEVAAAGALAADPRHPYTRALFAARPDIERRLPRLPAIAGHPVAAYESGAGCAFAPRCDRAVDACGTALPELVGTEHAVRCLVAAPPAPATRREGVTRC